MWTRRQFVSRGVLGLLGAGGVALAMPGDNRPAAPDGGDAQEALPDGSAARDMVTPRTDAAIDRGLAFLAARRNRDNSFGTNGYAGNVAVTSLGALAFMAAGNQPNRGPYGRIVYDALRFVLSMENRAGNKPGFLHNPLATPHGPMYGHGFGTLFLAEVSGMVNEPGLRDEVDQKLHRAVRLILNSQNIEGGWRYDPEPVEADLSVTICQIMALRAARNAGISVPKERVDRCVDYVKACQDRRFGYFRYQRQGGGGDGAQGFARTAAGVVALYSAGIYKGPEVEAGLEFLRRNRPIGGPVNHLDMHYFYGHYYAVQAMWAAGGDYWKEWYPAIRDELVGHQFPDGSWADGICVHYATAMACIILQVPNNYLPILQR